MRDSTMSVLMLEVKRVRRRVLGVREERGEGHPPAASRRRNALRASRVSLRSPRHARICLAWHDTLTHACTSLFCSDVSRKTDETLMERASQVRRCLPRSTALLPAQPHECKRTTLHRKVMLGSQRQRAVSVKYTQRAIKHKSHVQHTQEAHTKRSRELARGHLFCTLA